MWKSFLNNQKSPRKQILHNIDDVTGYASIRDINYKYIKGKLNIDHIYKLGIIYLNRVPPSETSNNIKLIVL